jgi:Zn-dependent protease with chaperone function
MSTTILALVASVLCLIVLPLTLYSTPRFDRNPIGGLVIWGTLCVVGWLSAVVVFLRVGLGNTDTPLFRALITFVDRLGDGHPLRGLGLSEVVGLSVAFDITVLMLGGLVVTAVRIWTARSQQRTVIDLVAEAPGALEGVCLLRHPYPMAYFLPGDGGRVVLSTGAVEVLNQPELDAVIAHENGHRNGRHGAVLIPLQVLASFVSFLPLARYAPTAIRAYLEMLADDFSRSQSSTEALKTALTKAALFQPPPVGALNAFGAVIDRRIDRLDVEPTRARTAWAALSGVGCAMLFVGLLFMGR